jgi:hypothetical protein
VWVQRDGEIEHHPRDKEQGKGKGKNPDSDIEMTIEEIPLWTGSRTPKWTWSPMVQYTRDIHAQSVIIG